MILRVPEYYREFSCIADRCKDSCCVGWEIDIDEDSYAYYRSCEGAFGDYLRENMYTAEDGGYRFRLKGQKRCAMLNDNNLCDLYTALGEEALCEVCTEHPRFFLLYGDVMQKGLSLSCEEAGRMIFHHKKPVQFTEHEMQDYYADEDSGEDQAYISFMEQVQEQAFRILQERRLSIRERMCRFLLWAEHAQNITNRYLAHADAGILTDAAKGWDADTGRIPSRALCYEDFKERFAIFLDMEVLDDEWVHIKKEFEEMFLPDTYERMVSDYLDSADYMPEGYENILVYFTFRYLMNAVFDFDILSYAKLVIVATLVIRDMDVIRYHSRAQFTMADRIDIARIFSKEVEHSEGNADALKEMCMMEEIASVPNLYRQI